MPDSGQILTVAQMRAAEQALIDGGETVSSLMDTAGKGVAESVWRVAAGQPVTVLCGPGNNGGDGYVIARELALRGLAVTVVAPLEPATEAAIAARRSWGGSVAGQGAGGVLVDCLFGSGLTRALSLDLAHLLAGEARRHHQRIAVDVPSGIESDSGQLLNENLPQYDLTLALGAWKRAHWLMPALAAMGERRLVPIGVAEVEGAARALPRPHLAAPAADAHKYTRGLVVIVGGSDPGAALLAARAAARGGAGYVKLFPVRREPVPAWLVQSSGPHDTLPEKLADARIACLLAGPGLGRDEEAHGRLAAVLRADKPLVLDGDALSILDPAQLAGRSAPLVVTPHDGEFARLEAAFDLAGQGTKPERALALAKAMQATVVAKGPDTVIAMDERLLFAGPASSWLSVAGSGDVLAGLIAARMAAYGYVVDPLAAAGEGVWLHGEAARLARAAFIASDLAHFVSAAYVESL